MLQQTPSLIGAQLTKEKDYLETTVTFSTRLKLVSFLTMLRVFLSLF